MASSKTTARTAGIFGVLVLFVAGIAAYSTFGSTKAYDESKTHPGANISTLVVRVPGVDVNIVPTDSDEVTAHFSGRGARDRYALSMTEIDHGLQVVVDSNGSWLLPHFDFGTQQLTLDVQVPKREFDQFTVTSSSGDIHLSTLEAKQLALTASSGDVEVPHFKGDTLKIGTSSGDVKIGDVQANVDLHTSSGKIDANGIKGTVHASTSSGRMTLAQIEGDTTLEASSGDVRVNGLIASHVKSTTSSGDQTLEKISGAEIDAQSSSGDVTIGVVDRFANTKVTTSSGDANLTLPASSPFELNFNTSSGNAKVQFPITYTAQDKHSMHGTVGTGGPLLDVHTSSGSLTVAK